MKAAVRYPTRTADLLERLCAPPDDPRPVPRTAIVVAHPDDEVVGAGGRLPRLGARALIVHVTDGAPRDMRDATTYGFPTREAYADARRRETAAALALAGVPPDCVRELGCVDQEACLGMAGLARALAALLADACPVLLLTHPYEGGHPDHDATALIARAACALLSRRGATAPAIAEMTSYHNGWNGIVTGEFLPHPGCEELALTLPDAERERKARMMACFATQQGTLQYFSPDRERFRPAPPCDFARPPHEGQLFYEGFDWGMTGARFCGLAQAALEELGLAEETPMRRAA